MSEKSNFDNQSPEFSKSTNKDKNNVELNKLSSNEESSESNTLSAEVSEEPSKSNTPDINQEQSQPKSGYKEIHLKDYKAPDFKIETIDLEVDLNDELTTVTSTIKVIRNKAANNPNSNLILNGEELKLVSVHLNDNELDNSKYKVTKDNLEILNSPDEFNLKIVNTIKPQENTSLSGLYKSDDMYCTQCEAEGFRRITYYLDRPDVMSSFTTTIKADKTKYPILLANGNLKEKGDLDNYRHYATFEDPFKKPCYLFAIVAGDLIGVFDTYITFSGRLITLQLYTEHKNLDKTAHAVEALKKSMRWDEKAYGREYDLDNYVIVAVDSFNMGAMENKGLNIFNSKYVLANPQTATDDDYAAIDEVVGHEYFHNWSGNRVTLRDWFQLSLKEGFTVFREQQFVRSIIGSAYTRIKDAKLLRARQFVEDAGPLAHPVQPKSYLEINNFYTVTIYEKGAEIIRMLHTLLGADTFRKATDLYFSKYDGKAVTIEELITSMEEASGKDLAQFRLWYEYAGTPEVHVAESFDQESSTYTINLSQECPKTPDFSGEKKPLLIPIAVGLIDNKGEDIPLYLKDDSDNSSGFKTTKILSLSQRQQSFIFTNVEKKPTLSILRDFSAPVKIKRSVDNKSLAFLASNDSDEFNRWDASQTLIKNFLKDCILKYKSKGQLILNSTLAATFNNIISDKKLNPMVKALIMQGVSIDEIINDSKDVDIDAINVARNFMLFELAKENKRTLMSIYYDNKDDSNYKYSVKDAEHRKLKNTALSYLTRTKDVDVVNICSSQFNKADNMTDQITALECLVNFGGRERENALGKFYKRWQDEPLVVNKWLSVQARSELPNTLDNVKRLMRHQAFDITNPNKVYSLVGGFCIGNPIRFHDKSGSGYQFLADAIIKLNKINPQVAARMISPLTEWHKFDKSRQAKMKFELQRINKEPNLSKDILEIVNKSLSFKA